MTARLPTRLMDSIKEKRLLFTVTTGRSGSGFLAKQLGSLPGVTSRHEPEPSFSSLMRAVQADPTLATEFWVDQKLPAISAESGSVYVETSHLFCKGFALPLLEMGVVPDLILLRRDHRSVALSLLALGTVPERSEKGLRYLLSPEDPGVLPLPGWRELCDYQLCLWYCLETERRQGEYARIFRSSGARVVETDLADISRAAGFARLVRELELPRPPLRESLRRRAKPPAATNQKAEHKKKADHKRPGEHLDLQRLEDELRERLVQGARP